MKSELQKKLYDRFPHMFRGRDKSIQESLMPFVFECGDGWFDILWRLCEDIEKLTPLEEFEVSQVKEKFGTLRFYTWRSTDEIEKRICKAERESAKTCEWCGEYGHRRNKEWIVTMCNGCYEEYLDGKRR